MNQLSSILEHDLVKKIMPKENAQHFYGHGKLLLSGEYFVLDGALALTLPVRFGQTLTVDYRPSFNPMLTWKSYDVNKSCWFEAHFEFWRFRCVDENPSPEALLLQEIFQQVRRQNPHFLRDEVDVHVETNLEFPRDWGLGSSSTLLYNIAQWAYISPFELMFNTIGGSGYDIACAQSNGAILFQNKNKIPFWAPVNFDPSFKDQLFLLYLGNKASTKDGVREFRKKYYDQGKILPLISELTQAMTAAMSLDVFSQALRHHEEIVGAVLDQVPIKPRFFDDYFGEVKSLGAWGGDFALVTVPADGCSTAEAVALAQRYFRQKGLGVFMPYSEMILVENKSEGGHGPIQ
ncbi:MAG TPA: GHMP kinase [Bdellovibrionales bacterium]|nr:GHMP kinase [Bdellovibrionales bacterium]